MVEEAEKQIKLSEELQRKGYERYSIPIGRCRTKLLQLAEQLKQENEDEHSKIIEKCLKQAGLLHDMQPKTD